MISTSCQLSDQEIKRVSDFYDWIRDDWLDISTDANGRNPGMLNFGYWKADTTNLCDAQIALIDKIFGWLQLPRRHISRWRRFLLARTRPSSAGVGG
jgi:hypothetical protein